MPEENKNLKEEMKPKRSSRSGNIIFWIGIVILGIGIIIGSIIGSGPSPEMGFTPLMGMIFMAIVGGTGLILTSVGLFIKEAARSPKDRAKRLISTFLIIIFGTVFLSSISVMFAALYENFILKTKNEFLCRFVLHESHKDNCYLNVAEYRKDYAICNRLGQEGDRYFCYFKVAETKKDLSICEKIPSSEDKLQISWFFMNEAYEKIGPKTTWGVKPVDIKDLCYKEISVLEKNINLCEEIKDLAQKDNCYLELVSLLKDSILCKKISDQTKKDSCYFELDHSVPYLGVYSVSINKEVQDYYKLSVDYGALIEADPKIQKPAVDPGSPADKAGIKEKDIILEINGKKINETNPLVDIIRSYNVGDEIILKVLREEKEIEIKVVLEKLEETANWPTYRFIVKELKEEKLAWVKKNLDGEVGEETEREIEEIIKELKLDNYDCDFEIKYPSEWGIYLMPSGSIFPKKLTIGENNGCTFIMSLYANPEKEKYCFPISYYNGKSDPNKCSKIFSQILSTFRFIDQATK